MNVTTFVSTASSLRNTVLRTTSTDAGIMRKQIYACSWVLTKVSVLDVEIKRLKAIHGVAFWLWQQREGRCCLGLSWRSCARRTDAMQSQSLLCAENSLSALCA